MRSPLGDLWQIQPLQKGVVDSRRSTLVDQIAPASVPVFWSRRGIRHLTSAKKLAEQLLLEQKQRTGTKSPLPDPQRTRESN
jgi:hypothetical protein